MLKKNKKEMSDFIYALKEDENGDSPYPWLANVLEMKPEVFNRDR